MPLALAPSSTNCLLTVVCENGEPAKGLYKFGTNPDNYLERRIHLYRDATWRSIALPTLAKIIEAHDEYWDWRPANWAQMTPEERLARLQELQIKAGLIIDGEADEIEAKD